MYLTPPSRYIFGTWISNTGLPLQNETKWWACVRTYRRLKSSYFTCMSTSGFMNTILRIRNFIFRSIVTSTSKTNFSKYGHSYLGLSGSISICFTDTMYLIISMFLFFNSSVCRYMFENFVRTFIKTLKLFYILNHFPSIFTTMVNDWLYWNEHNFKTM